MGLELTNEAGETVRLGGFSWATLLELAHQYGWKPLGTRPPETFEPTEEEPSWDPNNYGANDGQYVLAEDADSIADSLVKYLEDPKAPRLLAELAADQKAMVERMVPPEVAAAFVGLPSFEEYRSTIEEFVGFCRGGGFRIA